MIDHIYGIQKRTFLFFTPNIYMVYQFDSPAAFHSKYSRSVIGYVMPVVNGPDIKLVPLHFEPTTTLSLHSREPTLVQ